MSASELLLFVSVVLVLINALSRIPNYDDLVSKQLIYYDKKGPFSYIILLFEQFIMLQLSVSLCLKYVLVIGHCRCRNIKVPFVKNPELTNVSP